MKAALALLVLSLAAPSSGDDVPRGFFRLRVYADGREVGERQLNPRTVNGFRATSLAFDGPGRPGVLELELSLVKGGEPQPVPPELTLAVADPLLLDLHALGPRRAVVLISIDTLRRDHVGLYGYAKPTTPRLDALGRDGSVFDDAVSVSSWTLPAHFSMVTSVDPATHGAQAEVVEPDLGRPGAHVDGGRNADRAVHLQMADATPDPDPNVARGGRERGVEPTHPIADVQSDQADPGQVRLEVRDAAVHLDRPRNHRI
jgi:hypothetical protein